ncbi:MAG: dockerin type I repeat-containing protein, partial [Clostridiales bacterium]|nr:dockerin type I repeat-containing protein [Clostridiales bacterium]
TTTVYCHIWVITGDTLEETSWQTAAERCKYDTDLGLYYYDFDAQYGKSMEDEADYAVIFSAANRTGTISAQTYNITMGKSCYGDTLTVTDKMYENPEDSSQKGYGAVWSDPANASLYGPQMIISSLGEITGDCWPPHQVASDAIAQFINGKSANIESRIENEGYYCCVALYETLETNAYEVYTSYATLYADALAAEEVTIPTLDDVCRYLQCENPPTDPNATEEPTTEEVTTEEPTTEEVTTEEPTTEEVTTEASPIYGDVDGDGAVTAADVTAVQKASVKFITLDDTTAADVNNDGRVSVLDATCIQKAVVGGYTDIGLTGQVIAA